METLVRNRGWLWLAVIIVATVLMWLLGDVLLPFVLGAAIAYLLDPVADILEAKGLSRAASTGIITLSVILIVSLGLLFVLPLLITQMVSLTLALPDVYAKFSGLARSYVPADIYQSASLNELSATVTETLKGQIGTVVKAFASSVGSVINVAMLLVITPVVAVYMLLDWDRMTAFIHDLMPREYADSIETIMSEVDKVLSSFVRGMGMVCAILAVFYSVALMLVGLDYGLAIGLIAGLITFIPFVGSLVGGALAVGFALFQFWGDWISIGLVAGIFVIGQVAEGNVLTPKLVGGSVGLHPVLLMLALSVFGSLFGFVGMLIAVPAAAAIGVLARFATRAYQSSELYTGQKNQA